MILVDEPCLEQRVSRWGPRVDLEAVLADLVRVQDEEQRELRRRRALLEYIDRWTGGMRYRMMLDTPEQTVVVSVPTTNA